VHFLSESLPDGRHKCLLCPHFCSLKKGQAGVCRVRSGTDLGVELNSYGLLTHIAVEPIEKKPIWHFNPGMKTLSISGYSCNLSCDYCQNFSISQRDRREDSKYLLPRNVVDLAITNQCGGICFTYNEPTIYFEYIVDVSKMAKESGLSVILKTNAYINQEPWLHLLGFIDALNIDWKGNEERYKNVAKASNIDVFGRILDAIELNKHVEISVPVYHDSKLDEYEEFCKIIDRKIPIHLLKIFPANKTMLQPVTSDALLSKIKNRLLHHFDYVYIQNVFGDNSANTICKGCGKILIERKHLKPISYIGDTPCCDECPIKYEQVSSTKNKRVHC